MNVNKEIKINISKILGVSIRKALEFKKVEPFTEKEFEKFWKQLSNDKEFLEEYKNVIK